MRHVTVLENGDSWPNPEVRVEPGSEVSAR